MPWGGRGRAEAPCAAARRSSNRRDACRESTVRCALSAQARARTGSGQGWRGVRGGHHGVRSPANILTQLWRAPDEKPGRLCVRKAGQKTAGSEPGEAWARGSLERRRVRGAGPREAGCGTAPRCPSPSLAVIVWGSGRLRRLRSGPASPPGNCSDRPSPHLRDRYSITGACISPARSLQVPTLNPLSLSDPNIVRLKLTFNR